MLILYNTLQWLLIILLFPLIVCYIGVKAKYRRRILFKLGKNLRSTFENLDQQKKTIWVHALSVGEVTSAHPLVVRLRQEFGDAHIVFSTSTATGAVLAEKLLTKHCDRIIAFPLDIPFVVRSFIDTIQPDLFILVETDFWPNFLHQLQRRRIPAILINGRISRKSHRYYKRLRFFFTPMFQSFFCISVQNDSDKERLIDLGVEATTTIVQLGNLKYEPVPPVGEPNWKELFPNWHGLVIVAGSTHTGEEELLLHSFGILRRNRPIHLVIAPRRIERRDEILGITKKYNISAALRSTGNTCDDDVFILDTIGELKSFYALADIAFVGGSLVPRGGHNPLEPAALAKPVLFGQYTDDFEEICEDLLQSGGAIRVKSGGDLTVVLERLISENGYREQTGKAAQNSVTGKRGVLDSHIMLIRKIM